MGIQFLYPSVLWAISLISIPIIIHLFNFRRYKTVYFSNVRYLENVKKDTNAKKQWKELLILLIRILIIIFLVLAFAQPNIILSKDNKINKTAISVAVIVDNSLSMSGKSTEGVNIEIAKNKAYQITQAYPNSTSFTLLTTNPNSSQFHYLTKGEFYHKITNIQLSSFTKSINTVYAMLKDNWYKNENNTRLDIYIISDFQRKDFQNTIGGNKNIRVFLVPISSNSTKNIVLDTCYFLSPFHNLLDKQQLVYRISNTSKKNISNFPVQLFINDSLKAIATVNISPQKSITDTFSFYNHTKGIKKGMIKLDDFPIKFDNQLYFNYIIKREIQIAIIDDSFNENKYLKSLLNNDSVFNYQTFHTNNIDLQYIRQSDVLILNKLSQISSGLVDIVKTHLNNAHRLILFNDFNKTTNSKILLNALNLRIEPNDTSAQQIASINKNADLYKNSIENLKGNEKYPTVFSNGNILNRDAEFLIRTKQKHTLVAQISRWKSQILLFSFPISDKNDAFFQHPIFIPLMYNFINRSNSNNFIYHTTADVFTHNILLKDITKKPLQIIRKEGSFIPRQQITNNICKIFFDNNLSSGFYPIKQKQEIIDAISINDNRKESVPNFYNQEELNQNKNIRIINSTKVSSSAIQEIIQNQKPIWIYFILGVFILLLIETILLRYWKR